MDKYCLIACVARNIWEPRYFDTHQKAYEEMERLLIESIIDTDSQDEYLTENRELIADNGNVFRHFEITENYMWSNLDDEYDIDAKIFKVEF